MAENFAKRLYSIKEWWDYALGQEDIGQAEAINMTPLELTAGLERPLAVTRKGLAVREQALMAKILSMDPNDYSRETYIRAYHKLRTYERHGMGGGSPTMTPHEAKLRSGLYNMYTESIQTPLAQSDTFSGLHSYAVMKEDDTSDLSAAEKLGVGNVGFPTLVRFEAGLSKRGDGESSAQQPTSVGGSGLSDAQQIIPFALERRRVRDELASGRLDYTTAEAQLDMIGAKEKAVASQRYSRNGKMGPANAAEDAMVLKHYAATVANTALYNANFPTLDHQLTTLATREADGTSWMGPKAVDVEPDAADGTYFAAVDSFLQKFAAAEVSKNVTSKDIAQWQALRPHVLGLKNDQAVVDAVSVTMGTAGPDSKPEVTPVTGPASPFGPTPRITKYFMDLHERAVVDSHKRAPTSSLPVEDQSNRLEILTLLGSDSDRRAARGVVDTVYAQTVARRMATECVERGTVGFGVQAVLRGKANAWDVDKFVAKHADALADSVYDRCSSALRRAGADGSAAPALSTQLTTSETAPVIGPAYARVMADTLRLIDPSARVTAPPAMRKPASETPSYLDRVFTREAAGKLVNNTISTQLAIGGRETALFNHVAALAGSLIALVSVAPCGEGESPQPFFEDAKLRKVGVFLGTSSVDAALVRDRVASQQKDADLLGVGTPGRTESRFLWWKNAPTVAAFDASAVAARKSADVKQALDSLAYSSLASRVSSLTTAKIILDCPKNNEEILKPHKPKAAAPAAAAAPAGGKA